MTPSVEMLVLATLLLGAVDGRSAGVRRRAALGEECRDWTINSTTAVSTRSYDSAGNLLGTVDAGGHATTFGVNASGQVTAKTGPQSGEAWTFEYDVFGQLKTKALVRGATARAGWKGAVWSYEYGLADGTTVKETGPDGYTTSRWYNGRHQLLKELRSDVGATRSSSNEWTMAQVWDGPYLKSREEKEGAWVRTISRPRYDHRGRVLEETEAFVGVEGSAGYTYTTETPWSGRVASPLTQTWATQTKSGSRTGSLAVDGLGNTIERSWGVYSDQWEYDAAGRLVSEKLSGKPERRLHYVEGLADQETYGPAASVETTSYQYWASGRPRIRSEPDGRERRLTWNERGLLAKEEYGRGGSYDTRQYGYDAAGQRSFMRVGVAPEESQWDYGNGPRGELLSVTQPGATGGTFQYEYDERTQLARVTPPAGSASASQTFDHDYLGRQVTRTRGDATWTTSWADGAGTTLEPADPVSGVSRSAYRAQDGRGREAVVSWSGVASELTRVARQYGPHDGPLGVTEYRSSGNVEVAYGYDDRFLVTGITRGAESVTYGYTASGERSWEQSPGGRTDYDYDPLDRLWHASSTRGSTEFVWEPGGARLLDVKAPNLTECRRYDARGRLQWMDGRDPGAGCDSPAAAPIARFEYGYDERGNRTSETYNSQGVAESPTQYGYDAADRLTSVVSPSGAETTYGLLGDGSRNTVTTAPTQGGLGTTESYHYDARGGLTGITDDLNQPVATYQVDPAGRVLSETRAGRSKSFTWDAGGRLTAASVTVDGTTTASSFRYDHQGLRIWKQGPAGTTTYLWGAGELAEEVLPSGTRLRYERGGGLALAVGGETLLHDGLGSVVGRVGLGAPVMYRYDAWGSFQGTAGPTAAEPSLAYAGQHWDADLGLSYAQQRWYQPETGRFLSEDPVFGDPGRPGSLHAFGYANGNPLIYVDPFGEKSVRQLLEEAASNGRKEGSEGWMTLFNVLHAGWDTVDAISFGTMAKLDRIEDRVEARDRRYKGGLGSANYFEDVVGTASVGILKSTVAGGTGAALGGRVAPAASVAGRIAQGAGVGFLTMGSANLTGQSAEIVLGQKQEYDHAEFWQDAGAGAAFGGGAAALTEVARAAAPALKRVGARVADEVRNVFSEAWRDATTPWTGPQPPPPGTPLGQAPSSYGVIYFGDDVLPYYTQPAGATLGRAGGSTFFMPLEDSAIVRSSADAARYSGMAPSATKAYLTHGEVHGLSFPLEGRSICIPSTADAVGFAHFLEGGQTALRGAGDRGGFLLNPTREFVTPGGGPVPVGSVLFTVGPNGTLIPIRRF